MAASEPTGCAVALAVEAGFEPHHRLQATRRGLTNSWTQATKNRTPAENYPATPRNRPTFENAGKIQGGEIYGSLRAMGGLGGRRVLTALPSGR